MKHLARTALIVFCLGGLGAFLFAWSGLYNVGARAGHWPVTRWFLEFGMRNAVETHSMGLAFPDLGRPDMLHAGLAHYETACALCHGVPGRARSPVVESMLPAPPYLPRPESQWDPEEHFWIVKNGLKYTGMPAWAAEGRDDEIWAVVAAIRRLPTMDEAEYRRLAGNGAEQGVAACDRCHGPGGAGGGAFPRLAGQSEAYLLAALRAYGHGRRPSGIMQPMSAPLNDDEMKALARHYASLSTAPSSSEPADPALIALGESLALRGQPEARIASCASCHGPGREALHPLYPRLAGQPPAYLEGQLRLWRDGVRGGTPAAEIMALSVRSLTDRQITALSAYYGSLSDQD